VEIDPPTACDCCGSQRLRKLGKDVTRTLETTPHQWKVIEAVREKFSCRDCKKITQARAPFHGRAGPGRLEPFSYDMFEKFGYHRPLNRQDDRYAVDCDRPHRHAPRCPGS
jgi:transposase